MQLAPDPTQIFGGGGFGGGFGGMGGDPFGFGGGMGGGPFGGMGGMGGMGGGPYGGGMGGRPAGPRKDPPIEVKLGCSLEDLYNGTTRKMKIGRQVCGRGARASRRIVHILVISF